MLWLRDNEQNISLFLLQPVMLRQTVALFMSEPLCRYSDHTQRTMEVL